MKKLIPILLFPLFCVNIKAQIKTQHVAKTTIGKIQCNDDILTDMDRKSTYHSIELLFQNDKYSSIVDLKHVYFNAKDSATIRQFLKDCKGCIDGLKQKSDMRYVRDAYALSISSEYTSLGIILSDAKIEGYVYISPKEAQTIIDWFIKLGYKS